MTPEAVNSSMVLAQTIGAIAVVVLFLKHIKEERESREKIDIARHEALKSLHSDCHIHAKQTVATVEQLQNSTNETLRENTRVLGTLAFHLDEKDA